MGQLHGQSTASLASSIRCLDSHPCRGLPCCQSLTCSCMRRIQDRGGIRPVLVQLGGLLSSHTLLEPRHAIQLVDMLAATQQHAAGGVGSGGGVQLLVSHGEFLS